MLLMKIWIENAAEPADAEFRDDHFAAAFNRKGGDAAVIAAHFVRYHGHPIINSGLQDEVANGVRILFIGRQRDNFELVGVALLQIDQVGNFRAARSAPGRPEIQQYNFPFCFGQR